MAKGQHPKLREKEMLRKIPDLAQHYLTLAYLFRKHASY